MAGYAALTALAGDRGIGERAVGDGVYLIGVAIAALVIVAAARRAERPWRGMLRLLAASNLLWLAGEVIWSAYDYSGHGVPSPSAADALYLGSYAVAVAAVVVGGRAIAMASVGRWALDASIVVVTVGFSSYDLVIEPQLGSGRISAAVLVSIAYPLFGLAILMAVTSLASRTVGRLPLPLTLVAAACLVGAATDALNAYAAVANSYVGGRWMDIGWQAEAALLCLGAWSFIRGETRTVRVIWRWQDVNLPFILAGVAVAEALLVYSVLERRDDLASRTTAPASTSATSPGARTASATSGSGCSANASGSPAGRARSSPGRATAAPSSSRSPSPPERRRRSAAAS